ncbi:glycosyltransferase [Salinigranum marinum]|uniref:glycosyltransferase n=1 Tax=Salinigranum marinum TaxID=1515595 RepID=UPI00298A078D|nr:glycosyltransferase [Salinigranum marinum]
MSVDEAGPGVFGTAGAPPNYRTRALATAERSGALPRLAFFIPTMNLGGAQQVTVTIANGLAARGYAVDLVLARAVGPLLDRVDDAVGVVDLETPPISGVGVLAAVPALRRYLRRQRPDVLFAAMMNANVVGVLTHALAGVETRLVLTEHNTFGVRPGLRDRVTAGLATVLYPRADRVVGVSRGVADSVVAGTNVDAERVSVLYNPIDVKAIRAAAAEPLAGAAAEAMAGDIVFTVGRLAAAKDHATLLRAFQRVHERRPEIRLVVAGVGPKRAELESLADDLGLANAVTFVGFVDNAYAYMAAASVFVLSSKHEGLPTVLLEALACETPIVSTDCPSGPREILADGRYGRLVPVGDDVALAEAIVERLDVPTPAAALGTRAADFSLDAVLSEYESFIARVTEAGAVTRDGRS